ncbi:MULTISPECIES: CDP-glycerol glycerophosphotransferase family protein [Bacillus amyloliquefaciens group]|uniref:CDP-glycerol glycerophosphotransferase family protein n=1 Tax=Bacillus amyloliquefaciens group TaxID=1938374 RepID=UPI0010522D89|nr:MULTISPECIES: CDP-glycerol glycerophosphotransferase family protein [Bacillus amyloliquefaciens group]MBO3651955.1 CDP-glycerol glycerophosphotransferase family protein [Bacillus amyloliquefaciens]MCJ2174854.1 CDP-glycerol glycerophosphotransferase family protein [Bacillus amyloliquefaciens]MCR4351135.1 CDP-glycerol glycerophosphotransferase family protein [Bacillus amyloliquefaciens]MCR4358760.1 CDP-glycerol glycerophosphotransferase family protein [Bacillus amyloliquefaciens]MDX7982406.1 
MNLRSLFAAFYSIYLSVLGVLFKPVKPKNHLTLLVSFEENAQALIRSYKAHAESLSYEMTVLYTRHAVSLKKELEGIGSFYLNEKHPLHLLKAVLILFKSKVVITDNYFLMTSVLNRRPQTTCIQVWHANGSLKKFGLEDVTNQNRPASDISRFKKVYRSFDFVTVGSDAMADVFKKSFGIRDGQLLKTGVPLTDVYYEEHKPELKHKWPKKIILYAPTFRDYDMQSFRLPFTEEQLTNALHGEYMLLVKLHPAVLHQISASFESELIKNVSDMRLHDLLKAADILITDYSSVPFEFALLNKPIFFFTYDLEEYDQKRGLIDNYTSVIPGKACHDSEALLEEMTKKPFRAEEMKRFSDKWNMYSDGNSSSKLLQFAEEQITYKNTCSHN